MHSSLYRRPDFTVSFASLRSHPATRTINEMVRRDNSVPIEAGLDSRTRSINRALRKPIP